MVGGIDRHMALNEEPRELQSAGYGFSGDLTPQSLFVLDYHAPPPSLEKFITTLYFFRCDEAKIRDVQPAAVGHFMVFLQGSGVMHFPGGYTDPSHTVSLMSPCSAAVPVEVDGPFHCVGAALSPLGWAALTGLHAGEWADRLLPAADHVGAEAAAIGEKLLEAYASGSGGPVLCERLADFLATKLQPVNPRHLALLSTVSEWLSSSFDPPLDDLFAASAYSKRQTQRLVERYFGLPPRELKRKYRALRVVSLLAQPDIGEERADELADCFYDQSHMIREIRHFAGRTPGFLVDDGTSILAALLDVKNFREIKPNVAALPPGSGENDSQ